MFDQSDFGQLTEARVAELRDYRKLIVNAQSSLGDRGFSDIQLQRQQKIINDSLTFLDAAIQNRQVEKTALDDFARQMVLYCWRMWMRLPELNLTLCIRT